MSSLSQHTPICVPCQLNYRCELNGVLVRLDPDTITAADLYQCPSCGHQIVRGFAQRAMERHGLHQAMFVLAEAVMGLATITDRLGCPITQSQPACIPIEDVGDTIEPPHRY